MARRSISFKEVAVDAAIRRSERIYMVDLHKNSRIGFSRPAHLFSGKPRYPGI
jgi:hypothetical protein